MGKKRSDVEAAAIQAFMDRCSYDGGYRLSGIYAKIMSFTGNEIFLWDKHGDKLNLVGIFPYSLVLEKNSVDELVRAEIHLGHARTA